MPNWNANANARLGKGPDPNAVPKKPRPSAPEWQSTAGPRSIPNDPFRMLTATEQRREASEEDMPNFLRTFQERDQRRMEPLPPGTQMRDLISVGRDSKALEAKLDAAGMGYIPGEGSGYTYGEGGWHWVDDLDLKSSARRDSARGNWDQELQDELAARGLLPPPPVAAGSFNPSGLVPGFMSRPLPRTLTGIAAEGAEEAAAGITRQSRKIDPNPGYWTPKPYNKLGNGYYPFMDPNDDGSDIPF